MNRGRRSPGCSVRGEPSSARRSQPPAPWMRRWHAADPRAARLGLRGARWLLRGAAVAAGLVLCAVASAAVPDDFAEGLALLPAGDAPLQRVELPLAVYAGSARPDLGDLRVFAPDGTEVPYALVARAAGVPAPRFEALPIFPLPAAAASTSAVDVRVDGAGAVVSVQGAPDPTARVLSWLVDAGARGPAVRELQLRFAGSEDVLGTVDIDGSATLQAFDPWVRGAQVARLRHDGHALDQLRVPLPAREARYLRLTLRLEGERAATVPSLQAVLARRATRAAPPPRHTAWLRGRASAGWLTFDLGARLPVHALELDLGVDNSFVLARFECRTAAGSDDAAWQPLGQARSYRLRRGATVRRNEPFVVGGTHCAQVRVRAAPGDSGQGRPAAQAEPRAAKYAALPPAATLRAAWLPAELWFLRRGDGEHLLAFGANLVAPAPLPLAALREDARAGADAAGTSMADVAQAGVGARRTLGGADRRQAAPPVDWKQVLLWGVLVAGVLLVALLALRVVRDAAPRA